VREDGKTYHALIVCSFGVNDGYVLVGNKDYPQIASDYVATFAKARSLPVDVFLGSHGLFYGLNEKYAVLKNRKPGEPNPFVDPASWQQWLVRLKTVADKWIADETAKAGGTASR
jgi:metallo-beta-lactamase class B